MTIEVRFFASLVERAGAATETIEVDPSLDISGLWKLLVEKHPALAEISFRPLVACDLEYADWGQSLEGVSEVGFLPPVSGG